MVGQKASAPPVPSALQESSSGVIPRSPAAVDLLFGAYRFPSPAAAFRHRGRDGPAPAASALITGASAAPVRPDLRRATVMIIVVIGRLIERSSQRLPSCLNELTRGTSVRPFQTPPLSGRSRPLLPPDWPNGCAKNCGPAASATLPADPAGPSASPVNRLTLRGARRTCWCSEAVLRRQGQGAGPGRRRSADARGAANATYRVALLGPFRGPACWARQHDRLRQGTTWIDAEAGEQN